MNKLDKTLENIDRSPDTRLADENDYEIVTTTGVLISNNINSTVSTTIRLDDVYDNYANVDLLSKINDLETRLKALEEAYMELVLLGKSE